MPENSERYEVWQDVPGLWHLVRKYDGAEVTFPAPGPRHLRLVKDDACPA